MDVLRGKRVLVIDDSQLERELISTYLQQQGCRLYQAHDGIDGIHKARLIIPDLILMDADMPRCDGYAACKVLTQDPTTAQVPIIFLSAFSAPEQRVQGLVSGAVDYIGKPFDFDEVRLRSCIHMRCSSAAEPGKDRVPERVDAASGAASLDSILFYSARIHLLKSLAETPGIQELASQVGTNSKRLNMAFRTCVGMTVFEYLREERMKEAQQLLRNTSRPISDIACSVGFSSNANFSTAFKERFGATPSQFRREGEHA